MSSSRLIMFIVIIKFMLPPSVSYDNKNAQEVLIAFQQPQERKHFGFRLLSSFPFSRDNAAPFVKFIR